MVINASQINDYRNNFVLLCLIAVIAVSVFFYKSLAKEVIAQPTSLHAVPVSGSDRAIASEYKNGEYSATGAYVSPGGQEEIEINLILNNDIVEDIQFVPSSGNPTTIFFQEKFASGFKEMVIGKNINEVKLDHVAGSSLTSAGFNEAIEKIKVLARS